MTDEELIARLRKAREKRDEFEAVMLSDTAAHRIYNLGLLHDMAEARAEAAEARQERLRGALEALLGRHVLYCGGPDLPHAGHTDRKLFDLARSALTETATTEERHD